LIKILNRQMQPIAQLENAYDDGYEKRFNEVGSMWFTLPLDDEKNEHCNAFNFVEYTLDEYIGLYRIVPKLTQKDASRHEIQYECQHVISTLLDDVLFSYHQTTNWTTEQNIQYILDQQTETRWVLGSCEFTRYFAYKYENENGLLAPLLAIPQPFDEDWEWTYDTTVYPWVLNLVKPESEPSCVIREAHNRIGIEKEETNEVVNRIYPLGYGEGVNQLDIASVNGGVPYIEDAESISKYGLQKYVWIDRRFEKADELKANAQSLLKKWANPTPMYRISAADVSPLTGEEIDRLKCGKVARTYDSDLGVFDLRIMSERKDDARGNPGDVDTELGSLTEDIATVQADLEKKMQVNQAYSQGATNIDTYSYNDNADSENPATIRFYLPDELVNINKLELTYEVEAFRAYSKATKGGGATVSSTSSGGGTTATSSSGGGVSTSTQSGGGSSQTSSSGGGTTVSSSTVDFNGNTLATGLPVGSITPPYEEHYHLVTLMDNQLQHNHSVSIGNHSHSVSIPSHSHDFSTPNHSHNVTIPNHSHDITLPDHTHEILYGIWKDSSAPSSVTIEVDGNVVSDTGDRINIIPYLSKDEGGRVLRGQWHEVSITPNTLGRINANVFGQYFLQSRGGGTY
jgi:phage minor structural protein